MTSHTTSLKPAASRRTQLFVAALIWTIVGSCLLGFGLKWLLASQTQLIWLLISCAIVIGVVKGHFIFRKSAKRTVRRILDRGDGTCVFGVFPITSWLLVIVMMGGGSLLRSSGLPKEYLGTLYAAIGAALIMGSTVTWLSLIRFQAPNEGCH